VGRDPRQMAVLNAEFSSEVWMTDPRRRYRAPLRAPADSDHARRARDRPAVRFAHEFAPASATSWPDEGAADRSGRVDRRLIRQESHPSRTLFMVLGRRLVDAKETIACGPWIEFHESHKLASAHLLAVSDPRRQAVSERLSFPSTARSSIRIARARRPRVVARRVAVDRRQLVAAREYGWTDELIQ